MRDLHAEWPHRWVTPKAQVSRSIIHGLGVVANARIARGALVAVLAGVVVPRSQIRKYRRLMGHVGIQIDDGFFLCPTAKEELGQTGVFNHSCEPNIGYTGSIKLAAIRDILPGQELVFDYAFSESMFEPFQCRCTLAHCRGLITPKDWGMHELHDRYGKYFSPYLREKARALFEGRGKGPHRRVS